MKRSLQDYLPGDLAKKMVLVSGPRQVGKTTVAKSLWPESTEYLNYDVTKDRKVILAESWRTDVELLVLDEIHKMRKWKSWLKGVYDARGSSPKLLVTGSARLDIHRRGGDSMAGRFFAYRLHPFSVAELRHEFTPDQTLDRLMRLGGFPEPFLSDSERDARRWQRSHIDRILREDLLDLENVRDLKSIELLVDLLSERVGSQISYSSLAEDLGISPHTVRKWITVLENLYVIFVVPPYAKNVARAIQKQPKVYFYDTGRVQGDEGARLENVVACALLKHLHFLEDVSGRKTALHYVRDKEKREVDFLTMIERKPSLLLEVKLSDDSPSPHLKHFGGFFADVPRVQLVKNLHRAQESRGIKIAKAAPWLAQLETESGFSG